MRFHDIDRSDPEGLARLIGHGANLGPRRHGFAFAIGRDHEGRQAPSRRRPSDTSPPPFPPCPGPAVEGGRGGMKIESSLPPPSWNVAPTQDVPIIATRNASTRHRLSRRRRARPWQPGNYGAYLARGVAAQRPDIARTPATAVDTAAKWYRQRRSSTRRGSAESSPNGRSTSSRAPFRRITPPRPDEVMRSLGTPMQWTYSSAIRTPPGQ